MRQCNAPNLATCYFLTSSGWYPRPDLNRDLRFRKPLLYPVELRGQITITGVLEGEAPAEPGLRTSFGSAGASPSKTPVMSRGRARVPRQGRRVAMKFVGQRAERKHGGHHGLIRIKSKVTIGLSFGMAVSC